MKTLVPVPRRRPATCMKLAYHGKLVERVHVESVVAFQEWSELIEGVNLTWSSGHFAIKLT